ncbi:MAG: hypothetical protein ACRDT5_16970, partial [Mycobacterium sp.]
MQYNHPAPVRYCNGTALTNCEQNYTGSYTRPKFTGIWNSAQAGSAGNPATGGITVASPQPDSAAGSIQGIYVNGVNIITGTISEVSSFTPSTAATDIASAIAANSGTSGYTASASSNIVTVTATTNSATQNGYTLTVDSPPGTPLTPATGTISVTSISKSSANFSSIKVGSTQLLGSTVSPGTTNTSIMAAAVASGINAYTSTSGYSATVSGNTVTIHAPTGTGSEQNGYLISESDSRVSVSMTNMGGGVTPGDIGTTTTAFSGGANVVVAASAGRTNVGTFVRTSIVPWANPPTNTVAATYAKYAGRTDCAGASTCTYAEEMTNFANWYAYYRTRNTMTKTAIGRAFVSITSAFRVGMITLNPGSTVSSSKYLAVDDFNAGAGNQKDNWYTHIYSVDANSSTPTREALSRVGQYFAGLGSTGTPRLANGMGASPIEYACQANYTVLVTDGYWNGNAGQTLSGGSIGNQDNTDSGYHTRAIGAYDGGVSGASNTLADTAMYYYQTDLRTDLADEVPTTANDPNSAQHMDLFAVGLGLAGQLTYDSNYLNENATTGGDFWNIKQGSLNW